MSKRILVLVATVALAAVARAQMAPSPSSTGAAAPAGTARTDFSALKDAAVVGRDGEIGSLRDVIVDGRGTVRQLLIGEGGVLGVGETLRVLPATAVPPLRDGKVQLPDQGKEQIAALPAYRAEARGEASDRSEARPPVSGANQTAPQSARNDIPVRPGVIPRAGDQAASRPDPQPPTTPSPSTEQEARDSRAAQQKPESGAEKTSTGSGSSGMAPQQGTGTGASQQSPSANQSPAAASPAPPANQGLNQEYAFAGGPDNQPKPQDNAKSASGRPHGADAAPAGSRVAVNEASLGGGPAGTAPIGGDSDTRRWRIGEIVGETVRTSSDGLYVKDVRFEEGRTIVLLGRKGDDRLQEIGFGSLMLDGSPESPLIAIGTAQSGRPIDPGAVGAKEMSGR